MQQNRRLVKLFNEWRVYKRTGDKITQVSPPLGDLEGRINKFASTPGIRIESISSTSTNLSAMVLSQDFATIMVEYVVTYSLVEVEEVKTDKHQELETIPLPDGATSPTVLVSVKDGEGTKKAHAMAGVFGVVEGQYMGYQDMEVAPPVLLSPDCDMTKYKNLFGNIKRAS